MVDVERADDVGLISHRGGGDVRIMDRGEMNDRFGARHSFHDLAEILDVANQIVDRAALRPRRAIEDGDFVSGAIQQLAERSAWPTLPAPPVIRSFMGNI
mgnify:CR=1 FL=1